MRKLSLAAWLPLLFLLLSHTPATAQTTKVLLSGCEVLVEQLTAKRAWTNLSKTPAAVMCWGFMASLQDLVGAEQELATVPHVCLPKDVTTTQLAKVFLAYAREHPQRLAERPSHLVLTAWAETYPCAGKEER
jgi:Rap1a immunity proteins